VTTTLPLDAIPGGFFHLELNGTITAANANARRWWAQSGIGPAENNWFSLLPPAEAAEVRGSLTRLGPGDSWNGVATLGHDAHEKRFSVAATRAAEGFTLVLVPVADTPELGIGIRPFLRRMSHDLRVPLAAIRNALFLLSRHGLDLKGEREQRWIAAAGTSLTSFEQLLQRIDLLNRILAAGGADGAEPTHLPGLLEELGASHPTGGIQVSWPEELTPEWRVNSSLLRLALEQLIDNAVQHTPPGESVRLEAVKFARGFAVVVVDRGPGFRSEEVQRVFEPFFRSAEAKGTGPGLGLSNARIAVERAGGRLAYERIGEETVFRLTFASAQPVTASIP
jgi:signal transduction histidine kinase